MKKITSILILALCLTSAVFAENSKTSLPKVGGNQVCIVTKLSTTGINWSKRSIMTANFVHDGLGYKIHYLNSKKTASEKMENEYIYEVVNLKNGQFGLSYFEGFLFGTEGYNFYMPACIMVTVPEDAEYIYLGDFRYDLDYALRVTNVKRTDNFSAAQKYFEETFGDAGELSRGVIRAMTEDEMKSIK